MIFLGNKSLLDDKSAVILNSSQSKIPCGNDSWIKATSDASLSLIRSGYTLVTSLGLNTWELTAYLAVEFGGKQIIVSPDIDDCGGAEILNRIIEQFGIDPQRFAMVFMTDRKESNKPKANWENRDMTAISLANLLVPVSVRPAGRLEKLIENAAPAKTIESAYRVEYQKPNIRPPRYLKEEIRFDPAMWNYITHWTRTCHGPWPGQSKRSFYESLINSNSEYPNNALRTLINIARERRIRASSERLRKGERAVGFTESNPAETIARIRWLPKRSNWNFEPYGIAIRKQTAIKIGIRPVCYGDSHDYSSLPPDERPFFQSRGRKGVDWSEEKEWRHPGDINLTKIALEDIKFLTWRKSEADLIQAMAKTDAVALTEA